MASEQTVARSCVEKRSMVAERRTESELSRGEERKIAEFTKAVKVTTEEDWIPPAKRGQTDELHNKFGEVFL